MACHRCSTSAACSSRFDRPRATSSSQVIAPSGLLSASITTTCSMTPVAIASDQRSTWSAVSSTTTLGAECSATYATWLRESVL